MLVLLVSLASISVFYKVLPGNTEPIKAAGSLTILDRLLEGNARFVNGKMQHPDGSTERRVAISTAQHPFAVVLCCSDSRVPPELIFDQGLGDLFVIRTAGNLVDSIELGSIEYAVEHLGVNLVVVLGHEKCGVIKAFLKNDPQENHIKKLMDDVSKESEILDALKEKGDTTDNCVRANIRHITKLLRNSQPVLMEKKLSGSLTVVGARYDLDSGKVEVIE
jgi:carbonic anhydrase